MPLPSFRPRRAAPVALSLLAIVMAASPARAADPCDGFTWPVTQERALFAGSGTDIAAGRDVATAPSIEAAHLYAVRLAAQPAVQFAVQPEKIRLNDGAHAGLVRFSVQQPGRFRIAASVDAWIDVVGEGQPVPSRDFRGVQGCQAPHKIVEYDLPRAGSYVLQLSASAPQSVSVTLTAAPAAGR